MLTLSPPAEELASRCTLQSHASLENGIYLKGNTNQQVSIITQKF